MMTVSSAVIMFEPKSEKFYERQSFIFSSSTTQSFPGLWGDWSQSQQSADKGQFISWTVHQSKKDKAQTIINLKEYSQIINKTKTVLSQMPNITCSIFVI